MWCHARHKNPTDVHPERITRLKRETAENMLNYKSVCFPVSVKDYHHIEAQNHMKVNVTGYENKQFYPIYRLMAKEY